MFLVRISNELLIATFNRQLSNLIGQYSAISLMEDLMDDQSLFGDGKMVIDDLRSSPKVDLRSI